MINFKTTRYTHTHSLTHTDTGQFINKLDNNRNRVQSPQTSRKNRMKKKTKPTLNTTKSPKQSKLRCR